MNGFMLVDTLYLHMKYPYSDVFHRWYDLVVNVDSRKLKEGIVEGDFVIRNGACGYKVSLWNHDARIYLTDQTDDKCGDGQGMGIWIQLGPKFILENKYDLQTAVIEFLEKAGIKNKYPISITRLDVAIDLFDMSMKDQNINKWYSDWVGRSKVSAIFTNSRTGNLETIYIGSRRSPIYLRMYDKVAQSINDGDYLYWRDVWGGFEGAVTRIEWEIKPKDGNFQEDIHDFFLFDGVTLRELVNYLIDWGRLCDENPNDSNRRRWPDSKLWSDLRELVRTLNEKVESSVTRYGKDFHDVSPKYLQFVVGTLSGAIARLNENDPSFIGFYSELEKKGVSLDFINQKAKKKAEIYKRL